jgi:hypothetical protein
MTPIKIKRILAKMEQVCHPPIRAYGQGKTVAEATEKCLKSAQRFVTCEVQIEDNVDVPYMYVKKGRFPMSLPDEFLLVSCVRMWVRPRHHHDHVFFFAVPPGSEEFQSKIMIAQEIGNLDVFEAGRMSLFEVYGRTPFKEYSLPPGSFEYVKGEWISW